MRYQEYKPPIELASLVKLFWVFENRSNLPIPETIVADGFPELIFHFHSPFAEIDAAGEFVRQPTAVVCGQLTRPLILHSAPDAGMIGIRFKPNGLAPFLSTSMQSLTDARVSAEELFDVDQLADEILESSNDAQRVAACTRFLIRSINYDRENVCVRRAVDKIILTHGRISVESLTALTGRSRRSLELAFEKEVGVSPKMYCRITRFRHLIDTASNSQSGNWAQRAIDSGFFDQSHLIRNFRRFAGDTPTSFLADQTKFARSVNQI